MSKLDTLLATLHEELAQALLERIRSGANAAEMNVVRQFLKDNNIDAVPKEDSPLGNLVSELPFTDGDGPTFN